MPKFKVEKVVLNGAEKHELVFNYQVNIDVDGNFYTNLPPEVLKFFDIVGIKTEWNTRTQRYGYFCKPSYKELTEAVMAVCKEYVSRELVEETIVLKYSIETMCSYLLNNGDVVPNGNWPNSPDEHGSYTWKNGTKSVNATWPSPYGILIYCKPFMKRVYQYRSGTKRTEYDQITDRDKLKFLLTGEEYELQDNLKFLAGLTCISEIRSGKTHEIEYTEAGAYFFANMIKSICLLNEKIKDFIDPENIVGLIESKFKLLQ